MLFGINLNKCVMKECVITVKKVYETKRSRTVTERSVVLGEEELSELCVLVCEHVYSTEGTLLHPLFEALREV